MTKCIISLFALLVLVASCSKTDSVVTPDTTVYSKVTTGSNFTFDDYSTDSSGARTPRSGTTVDTILQTGASHNGKSNAFIVQRLNGNWFDTLYYAYEANNDISMELDLHEYGLPKYWVSIPISSKQSITSTESGPYTLPSGEILTVAGPVTMSYIGDESMTIKGQSVSVRKMRMKWLITQTNPYCFLLPHL